MNGWLTLLLVIVCAVGGLLWYRQWHQRRRRETRLRDRETLAPMTSFKTVFPDAEPITDDAAHRIVEAELHHRSAAEMTPNEVATETMHDEASPAEEAPVLPAEALPAFGDNVVVARMAGPQLLLESAREILSRLADDTDGEDLPDPLVRALDGGGAAMVMPAGAGVETTLYVLDLLRHPGYGDPVPAEAWVTIRHDDVFLSVNDAEANAALERAIDETTARLGEGDARFGESLTAAISTRLVERGLPYGARLYAFYASRDPQAGLSLTDDAGGGYVTQWDSLEVPRLRAVERVERGFVDVPEDVREVMGL